MGCWIPGPDHLSWPANQRPQPESPHQAAIAEPAKPETKSEAKPRRRRSTKPAE